MPDLIRHVHYNTSGLAKLIKTFQMYWEGVVEGKVGINSGSRDPSPDEASPPTAVTKENDGEKTCRISKRQLEKKIQQIAVKEVRPPSTKNTWYVHESILEKYKIDSKQLAPLPPLTPKSQVSTAKSCSPEALLSTPVNKKGTKRKVTGAAHTPSIKDLFAKSPQNGVAAPKEKRLKFTPSPVSGGFQKAVATTGECTEPPKKRIRLESQSLKSPDIGTRPHLAKNSSQNPLVIIDISDEATSVPTSTGTNPVSVTPSRKPLTARKPPPQDSSTSTQSAECVAEDSGTKCLQEVTNQQEMEGCRDKEEGKQSINWQKLNKYTPSCSTQVTVIAEVH